MPARARFDLKMDADEKEIVARAAALMGTTMAGFVRAAAKEKAMALVDREARVTLTKRDFMALTRALKARSSPTGRSRARCGRQRPKSAALEEQSLDPDTRETLYLPLG